MKQTHGNLIGKTFWLLSVVAESPRKKTERRWSCICKCGGSSIVTTGSLVHGRTKSCGCLKKVSRERRAARSAATAEIAAGLYLGGMSIAMVAEKLGKSKVMVTNYLKIRQVGILPGTPCLTGKIFGLLTVLEAVRYKSGGFRWKCRCRCEKANIRYASTKSLRDGGSISCGCLGDNPPKPSTEKRLETYRRYHKRHAEKRRAYSRNRNSKHREENRSRSKTYYAANRENILDRSRRYQKKFWEKARAAGKKWRAKHPGYSAIKTKIARQRDPERFAAYDLMHSHKRRAQKAMTRIGTDRKSYLAFVKLHCSHAVLACYWCKKKTTKGNRHLDHIIPLSRHGRDDVHNLCIACKHCNMKKSAQLPHEFSGQFVLEF